MEDFLREINDPKLDKIINCVPLGDPEDFRKIRAQFPNYDIAFLWLICYPQEEAKTKREYLEQGYKKYKKFLDSDFPKKLASAGGFESRMWELILCDVLSASGELVPKPKKGVDFHLKAHDGQIVQIEAVASSESENKSLRSIRPDYARNNFFERTGNIEDLERPVLLRVLKSFIDKAKKENYAKDKPLVIAINSYRTVGLVSGDEYVLRRILFGLGFTTIIFNKDGSHSTGLQPNPLLNKPGKENFDVAVFQKTKYEHISGVIYTSQSSLGFIPGGHSWHNSGITFVPNPLAKNPIDMQLPYFKKLICNKEIYREISAEQKFKSSLELNS